MLISLNGHKSGVEKQTFREIRFERNRLNIVLAEKSKESGDSQSRNGLGKSTFVQIVDFCLGASVSKDEGVLPLNDLADWTFTLEFDVRGQVYSATRGANDPEKIFVEGPIPESSPVRPALQHLDGISEFSQSDWRKFLSWAFFSLSPASGSRDEIPEYKNLISHFIRQFFDDPVRASRSEAISRAELATTYLLGLDWQYIIEMRKTKQESDRYGVVESAAEYQIKDWGMDESRLEQKCQVLENEIQVLQDNLAKFKTAPQFVEVNESVSDLTSQIHKVESRIVRNSRRVAAIDEARNECYVPFCNVEKMYADSGRIFSTDTREQLDKVRQFHERVTKNRETIMENQKLLLENLIEGDTAIRNELDDRRTQAIAASKAQSAFEEYSEYQKQLNEKTNQLALKRDCLTRIAEARKRRKRIAEERQRLTDAAKETHETLRPTWGEEEKFFHDLIMGLYDIDDGTLGIEITQDPKKYGITYKPHFKSDRSQGKKKLKAFAMDLTILDRQPKNKFAIDFMVHDSVLYESTDSRQYAKALRRADELCRELGVQYVCVMNSDDVQNPDFESIFPFAELDEKFVIHRLSDKDTSMTLLGENF